MKRRAIARHHITYEPERVVYVFNGEHQVLSLINLYTRKTISKGFLKALRKVVRDNAPRAVELKDEYERRKSPVNKKSKGSV